MQERCANETVLHSAVHCTILLYNTQHYTNLYCNILLNSTLHCTAVSRTAQCSLSSFSPVELIPTHLQVEISAGTPSPHNSAVQCSEVQCSAVQCSAVQCSAVHCSAVQCSAVQCNAIRSKSGCISPPKCLFGSYIYLKTSVCAQ